MNERDVYKQTVKLVEKLLPKSAFLFGTVIAYQNENRTVKVLMEPEGIETGWCKCLQGAFADKIGMEVLLGRTGTGVLQQYIVLGIVE